MKVNVHPARSLPQGESSSIPGSPSQTRKGKRAAVLIVIALILLAAFVVAAPAISSGLKFGYSVFSGLTSTLPVTQSSGGSSSSTTSFSSASNCSGVVSVRPLASPDINGSSADISYPQDYCALASYALAQINADRAANGTGPVELGYNQAAQQHADSMLYHSYFSHYDVQGYKPYMRYTLLNGKGADYENIAFFSYSIPHYTTTGAVEQAIMALEHSMVYDDAACCNNGHRYNILSPMHNVVSIGVAYNSTFVYFDEEFENDYVSLNFTSTGPASSNPYFVTMKGTPIPGTPSPNSIYIGFDNTPSPESTGQLNSGPHEYGPGTIVGGVLPPSGLFGSCGQFTSGTTVCATTWTFNSKGMDISFSLQDFVKNYGAGVYTVYLITGSSTDSAITSISIFVS